ncbi:MAG: carbonic anhydrase [Caulobacteraceae bacterium]|nr:carbonic anhydrase [Caulobacteraceae bacterium]
MFGIGKKKSGGKLATPTIEASAEETTMAPPTSLGTTPDEALQQLRDGNAAFLRGENNLGHVKAGDLDDLQGGQSPIATIVGCADSRTPPTILFNQGFGRLFSIRVAGNTVDRRGLSSIVYAVKHLKCPLVVVMGHTGCGAVAAAESIVDGAPLDPSLEEMIVPIIPPVLAARAGNGSPVEENARWVARKLATADASLADAIEAGTLKIVAAVKQMHSGEVKFLDV